MFCQNGGFPGSQGSYLVEFQRHPHAGGHHPVQELHVRKHPLVPGAGDAEVPLKEGVEAVQEGLQAGGNTHTRYDDLHNTDPQQWRCVCVCV